MKKTHKIISYLLLIALPISRVLSQVVMCVREPIVNLFKNVINNELYVTLIYLVILISGLVVFAKGKKKIILLIVMTLISYIIYYFFDSSFDGIYYIADPCGHVLVY